MALSRPWIKAIPSPTRITVPTSLVSRTPSYFFISYLIKELISSILILAILITYCLLLFKTVSFIAFNLLRIESSIIVPLTLTMIPPMMSSSVFVVASTLFL